MASRIEDATWEKNRVKIQRLFMTEDRKLLGPGGVIEIMLRDHGFMARQASHEIKS